MGARVGACVFILFYWCVYIFQIRKGNLRIHQEMKAKTRPLLLFLFFFYPWSNEKRQAKSKSFSVNLMAYICVLTPSTYPSSIFFTLTQTLTY